MAMYDNLLANVPTDLWIGGKWKKSSDGGRFDVIDPASDIRASADYRRFLAPVYVQRALAMLRDGAAG